VSQIPLWLLLALPEGFHGPPYEIETGHNYNNGSNDVQKINGLILAGGIHEQEDEPK
jgi:hypothetical protein